MTDLVYGRAAPIYRQHGWAGVLPLPEGQKAHPPSGFTGATGADPTDAQVMAWCEDLPNGNIALRLPEGVIGIDIDAYLDKHGDVSLLALEASLGTLPATWRSTSREVLRKSGIYLFRVPPGRYHDKPAPNIEVIQHHHRYVVVMPSIHPEGRPYFWYDATDTEQRRPPRLEELAELPDAWVEHLREKPRAEGQREHRHHEVDDWTPAVTKAFTRALMEMAGGRHDATLTAVMALARLDRLEHPGAGAAMAELGGRFRSAISDRSTPKQADKEWADMVDGAYEIADSTPATAPKWDATWKPGADPNWRPWWEDKEAPAPPRPPGDQSPDLVDVISSVDPDYEWLIPQLLEKGDRVIITGPEGKGKSTLLRQMGVQIASGLHPFTPTIIDPVNILLVDCENSQRQVRRKLGPLHDLATDYQRGRMRFEFRTDGLDLCRPDDRGWLTERIQTDETQLLIIGPLYKLQSGDPKDEPTARAVALFLDTLRQGGLAIIIEAHSPYADGNSKRATRPYGASLWSRWPEFGIHLAEDGTITHWRGQREERAWPTKLERGQPWPWIVGVAAEEPTPWEGPKQCMLAVRAYMEQIAPEERSLNALRIELRALGLSYRDATVTEAAERLVNQGALRRRKGPRNATLYGTPDTQPTNVYPFPDEPF